MEKVIFGTTMEGLYRALGSTLTPADLDELRAIGVDFARPIHAAYPLATFHKVQLFFGSRVAPTLPPDDQIYEVARRFMGGFIQTLVGKAALALGKLVGPKRTLQRLNHQFRNGNNYSDTKLTELAPNRFELWCNQVMVPGWYRGILVEGLTVVGAKDVKVTLLGVDGQGGATFLVEWAA